MLGTGQVGATVARVLVDRDADVRVVNRSGDAPPAVAGEVAAVGADLSEPEAARDVCDGADVVYFCLQPPYHQWPALFPPLVEAAVAGVEAADARLVVADNLYAYGPTDDPLHEDLPADAATPQGRTRARMTAAVLDAHDAGRIRATVGRASDFYGPGVTQSVAGDRLFPQVVSGGTVWFPGDPDAPHTYTYIRDFARALVVLGSRDEALGSVWHVPSARTLTTREFVSLAGDVAGTDPTVRRVPGWLLWAFGVVSPTVAALRETQYQRTAPFEVSHAKFDRAFDLEPTPHRTALEATVAWYDDRE